MPSVPHSFKALGAVPPLLAHFCDAWNSSIALDTALPRLAEFTTLDTVTPCSAQFPYARYSSSTLITVPS